MTLTKDDYLAALRAEARSLPAEVAGDLIEGITEELRGLDDHETADRLRELGDPASVVAAARAELGAAPSATPAQDATWYTVITAFLLLIGGIIVPVVGWIAGVVLLWLSKTWTLRDKIAGTLIMPAGAIAAYAAFALVGSVEVTTVSDGGTPVTTTEQLVPTHLLVLINVFLVLPIITFVYLLIRANWLKRRAEVSPSTAP